MERFLSNFDKFKFIPIDNINCLKSPAEFFEKINSFLRMSNDVFILCLYMGTGEFSEHILDAIKQRHERKMHTRILLDNNRAKRTLELDKMVKERGIESLFSFFNPSPAFLLFPKIKELYSVLHSKIFIFDSTVILTGANLDDAYMHNRLDRYLVVNSEELSKDLRIIFYQLLEGKNPDPYSLSGSYQKGDTQVCIYNRNWEESVLKSILEGRFDEVTISTGYLNFPKRYLSLLETTKVKILTSGPKSSTYTSTRVFEKNVNESYSMFAADTQRRLVNSSIYEFCYENLTFHCKGLWAFSEDFGCFIAGSSNFNTRSARRDIETNFLIVSKNRDVLTTFREEHDRIVAMCKKRSLSELESRKIHLSTKVGAYILQNYL